MVVDVQGAGAVARKARSARAADDPLERVFRTNGPALVGLARLLLDDPGQAEEVVQEAFVRTYAAWPRVRSRTEPLPYVRRTVVNLARGGLRRRRTERRHRFDRPVHAPSAEAAAAERAQGDELAAAVAELPRRQRECVVLRFYGDCSVVEIAQTLRISDGSVKQHLHRALASLERELADDEEDDR
jgi:RNA polymerase sigma-70 factor (sigma-E family)